MKDINLISLTQAAKDLSKNSFKTFRNYYGINISDSEIKDLENLIAIIKKNLGIALYLIIFLLVIRYHKSVKNSICCVLVITTLLISN